MKHLWPSKWNYKLYFNGNGIDKSFVEAIRKDFSQVLINEFFDVNELKWNDFEIFAIIESMNAINMALEDLGFKKLQIDTNQIKILSEKEFQSKISHFDGHEGKYHFGFVYVKRTNDKCKFIRDLTHELSHLVGFYGLRVEAQSEDSIYLDYAKSGFVIKPKIGEDTIFFEALDEAATELFANKVRCYFSVNTELLTENEKQDLINTYSYWEIIFFLYCLIDEITKSTEKVDEIIENIMMDMISGKYLSFKFFKSKYPKFKSVFRKIRARNFNIEEIALELGGKRLASLISKKNLT